MPNGTIQVVIDSNGLQSEELRLFLAASPKYKAIITDYAWMEAYKGNSVKSITKSMEILCDFPAQVILLKGTKAVGALDARTPGIAKRMIWPRSEGEFSKTAEGLRQAAMGDPKAIAQILRHGEAAEEQMAKVLADAATLLPVLADTAKLFTDAEIQMYRKRVSYSPEMGKKILFVSNHLFRGLIDNHPDKPRNPSHKSKVNTFLYRYAFASVLYLLIWIREGGQMVIRPDKIRNDMIDLNFAVFGTYFNGLMTNDARLLELYVGLRVFLERLGARMPVDYVEVLAAELPAVSEDHTDVAEEIVG